MTTQNQLLARAAARNNAEWCAAMSRSHGLVSAFEAQAWAAPVRTPPFYPDAVTLVPDAAVTALVPRIDITSAGASVKDSFADLDLTDANFQVLFEAQWIHRPASAPAIAPDLSWNVADDPDKVRAWALAWDNGNGNPDLFRPELLDEPATLVLTGRSACGRVVAVWWPEQWRTVAIRWSESATSSHWTAALMRPGQAYWTRCAGCSPPCLWSATSTAMTWRPPSATASSPSVRCGSGCTARTCPADHVTTSRRGR